MADILVVDDEKIIASSVAKILARAGHSCTIANSGIEAIQHLKKSSFALVIADFLMPEISGKQVVEFCKQHSPTTKVIVMTAYGDSAVRQELTQLGAAKVISKPFEDISDIPKLVSATLGT